MNALNAGFPGIMLTI